MARTLHQCKILPYSHTLMECLFVSAGVTPPRPVIQRGLAEQLEQRGLAAEVERQAHAIHAAAHERAGVPLCESVPV